MIYDDTFAQGIQDACFSALLHNIGKACPQFHQYLSAKDNNIFYYQLITGLLKEKIGEKLYEEPFQFNKTLNDLSLEPFPKTGDKLRSLKISTLFAPFSDRNDYYTADFIELFAQGKLAPLYLPLNPTITNITTYEVTRYFKPTSFLTHIMAYCHYYASGGEKSGFYQQNQRGGKTGPFYETNPFGFETKNSTTDLPEYTDINGEIETLFSATFTTIKELTSSSFTADLEKILDKALADTTRPFHDISVYNIGKSAAALLRPALWFFKDNASIKTHENLFGDPIRYRLISIGLNGLDFLSAAPSLAELRVRKTNLTNFRDTARNFFEQTMPIASVIYEDENGPRLLFPDCDALIGDGLDSWKKKKLIWKKKKLMLNTNFGIVPGIISSEEKLVGHPASNEGTYIGKALHNAIKAPPPETTFSAPLPEQTTGDRCPSCGIRRISNVEKRSCNSCYAAKTNYAQSWWNKDKTKETMWVNELADKNGRVALIVGCLGIDEYLTTDCLPASSGKDRKGNNSDCYIGTILKPTTSFAHIQRTYDEGIKFWQTAEEKLKTSGIIKERKRYILKFDNKAAKPESLTKFASYDLQPKDSKNVISLLYLGDNTCAITENDERLSRNEVFGSKWKENLVNKEAGIFEGSAYGRDKKEIIKVTISSITEDTASPYIPAAEILSESRNFMLLLPAESAWRAIEEISSLYTERMGKQRSRIPMVLGVVYAPKEVPFRTVLDAGRRMLKRNLGRAETWTVETQTVDNNNGISTVGFKNGRKWEIPTRCNTAEERHDDWFPYVFVKRAKPQAATAAPPASFLLENTIQTAIGHDWQGCHIDTLLENDEIRVTPSTIDIIYLGCGGDRFQLAYDAEGKRLNKSPLPFYIEDFQNLDAIYKLMSPKKIHRSALYAIRNRIEEKRELWKNELDLSKNEDIELLREYSKAVILTVKWREKLKPEELKLLSNAAAEGVFDELFKLHMQIEKGEDNDKTKKNNNILPSA